MEFRGYIEEAYGGRVKFGSCSRVAEIRSKIAWTHLSVRVIQVSLPAQV